MAVIAALVVSLTAVQFVAAYEGRTDDIVVIAADEVVNDDLYVGADELIIDGTVEGDVFVGATTVTVNGLVTGDLFAGATEITINGEVGDDLRGGSSALTINGRVGDDVLVGGYAIKLGGTGEVGGDMFAGGYSAIVDGAIEGDLRVGALGARLAGTVGGDAIVEVGSSSDAPPFDPAAFNPAMPDAETVAAGLEVADSAEIAGELRYEASQQFDIPAGVVAGETIFSEITVEAGETVSPARRLGRELFSTLQRWLLTLLVAGLFLRFAAGWFNNAADALKYDMVSVGGRGLLWYFGYMFAFALALIAVIMLAVLFGFLRLETFVGAIVGTGLFGLGSVMGLYVLVLLFVTKAIVGYWLGQRLLGTQQPLVQVAAGTLIVHVLTWIPFVGWLINFVITILGLGAILANWRRPAAAEPVEKSPEALAGA